MSTCLRLEAGVNKPTNQHPVAFIALTLLVGNQEEHPVCKNCLMRCWHGYLSAVRCKWFAYGPADATATPIISCLINIQTGSAFLVPTYPCCPGKKAVKWMFVLCICKWFLIDDWKVSEVLKSDYSRRRENLGRCTCCNDTVPVSLCCGGRMHSSKCCCCSWYS